MKTIFFYIKDHIKKDYQASTYIITAIFLFIAFFINYFFNIEKNYMNLYLNSTFGYLLYIGFYAIAYFPILLLKLIITRNYSTLSKPELWIKSIVFISLIGLANAFYYYKPVLSLVDKSNEIFYLQKILNNSKRIIIYIIPLIFLKLAYDNKQPGIYGLLFKKLNLKPYLLMLLLISPFIFIASFQNDFLQTYPKIKPWALIETFGLKPSLLTIIFEFVYAFDFVFVELMFRGALIIGMVRLLGKDAILPMVCAYAFLHFGKPLAEAISSVFGGYILGVIALYSRNIIGGSIVHMGVALMMEFFAMLQHYIFSNH
ncbi:MAG: hypothetical protein Kow0068_21900 [Marinilabiliales bacterium]